MVLVVLSLLFADRQSFVKRTRKEMILIKKTKNSGFYPFSCCCNISRKKNEKANLLMLIVYYFKKKNITEKIKYMKIRRPIETFKK